MFGEYYRNSLDQSKNTPSPRDGRGQAVDVEAQDALTKRGALDLAIASCHPSDNMDSNKHELEQLINHIMTQMASIIEKLSLRSVSTSTPPEEHLLQKAKEYADLALMGHDVYTSLLLESHFGENSWPASLYMVHVCKSLLHVILSSMHTH